MLNNILITGIDGFVGKNLYKWLVNGCNKYAIYGLVRNKNEKNLDVFNLAKIYDFTEIECLNHLQFDTIVHLAGKAHDLRKNIEPALYIDANIGLTKKIFALFRKTNSSKFIFMSSVKAVADSVEGVLTEDIEPAPKTIYGKTKQEAELYLLNQKLSDKEQVFILRPCMIHGEGNKGNLNLLFRMVKNRIPYPLGGFKNKRSFLYIKNLCFVLNQIIENDVRADIYNLADNGTLSTNEVIKMMGNVLGVNSNIFFISPQIISFLVVIGDFLHLPLNSEKLQKLTENYVVSNNKIKEQLLSELPYSITDGMIETIKTFKNDTN